MKKYFVFLIVVLFFSCNVYSQSKSNSKKINPRTEPEKKNSEVYPNYDNIISDNDYKIDIVCPAGYYFGKIGILVDKYYLDLENEYGSYRKYFLVKAKDNRDTIAVTVSYKTNQKYIAIRDKYFSDNARKFPYYYEESKDDISYTFFQPTSNYFGIFYRSSLQNFENLCGDVYSYHFKPKDVKDYFKLLTGCIKINASNYSTIQKEETNFTPANIIENSQPLKKSLEFKKTTIIDRNSIAILIGNKNYKNKDIPSVDYALNDMLKVKEYLISSQGFEKENIIEVLDATQSTFNSLFGTESNYKGRLFNLVDANITDVYVYYSGHGAPDPDTKSAYFVPVDCNPSEVSLNGYSLKTFYKNLSKIPCKNITIIIDACFSGMSDKGALIRESSPIYITTDEVEGNLSNAIVLTSAKSDQISSWYPEKGYSLFTYFYLQGLCGDADKNYDNKISLDEIKEYLEDNVSTTARKLKGRTQNPQIKGDYSRIVLKY